MMKMEVNSARWGGDREDDEDGGEQREVGIGKMMKMAANSARWGGDRENDDGYGDDDDDDGGEQCEVGRRV